LSAAESITANWIVQGCQTLGEKIQIYVMNEQAKPPSGIASNIAWVSTGNGIILIAGLASSILLARWLGPEARGFYALIMTTSVTLAALLGNNAWVQAIAFFAGKKRYSPPQITGHSILMVLLCLVALAIPLLLLPGHTLESLFPELRPIHLWIVVLLTTSTLLFGTIAGLLTGLNQIPLFTTLTIIKAVVALLLQFILLGLLSMGLQGALWQLALSAFLAVCMALAIFIWKSGIDLRARKSFLKDAVTYGGKSYPGHLGVVLLSRVDIYFVALFGGLEAAGFYAVAKGLTEIVGIIEQSISRGVMPNVIAGDFTTAGSITARAFRVSFWFNGLVLLIGALSARWLIPLVYGTEFAGAVPAFLLLLPGVLMLTTRTLGTFFSMQLGRPEIPTYYVLASGLVSLPLSYVLTRQFGYLGAAAAFSLVAVLRGVAAIALFVIFSHTELKHVLLPTRADLLWLPQMILSRLGIHNSPRQKV